MSKINSVRSSVQKIYCYIDESGDLGLKPSKTSTTHFAVAAVLVFDEATKIEIEALITRFKQDAKIPPAQEIKFHSLSDKNKCELLSRLKKLPIQIYGFVVLKQDFAQAQKITKSIDFHQAMLAWAFTILRHNLRSATVMIDRSIDARLEKLFRKVVKQSAGGVLKIKIVFARSKNQAGLQLADLAAGSLLRFYEKNDRRFFEIIEPKTKLYPFGESAPFQRPS